MPRARKSESVETRADTSSVPVSRTRRTRLDTTEDNEKPRPKRVTRPKAAPLSSVSEPKITDTTRKAPTPFQSERQRRVKNRYGFLIVMGIAFVLSGAGIFIGFQDAGAINISSSVAGENARLDAEGSARINVPVQNVGNLPNGGLRQADEATNPPVPVVTTEATTSNATTTEDTGTTSAETVAGASSTMSTQ